MKYRIVPGNIAAIAYIERIEPDFTWRRQFMYMAPGCIIAEDQIVPGTYKLPLEAIIGYPEPVKDALRRHFDTVFALPVEERGAYLEQCKPIIVEEA